MSQPAQEDLPPLGRPTPDPRSRTTETRSRITLFVAVLALAVGLLAGIPVGQALDGEPDEQALPEAPAGDVDQTALPTTTTLAALPQECIQTIRSAQQALVLLDEGLQSLGQLDLVEVETVLADMQQLREGFAQRARECLDNPRVGIDG